MLVIFFSNVSKINFKRFIYSASINYRLIVKIGLKINFRDF